MKLFDEDVNFRRCHAKVLGCLRSGWLEVAVGPGIGMLDGGIPTEIPIDIVPIGLRTPNTEFILVYDKNAHRCVAVEQIDS